MSEVLDAIIVLLLVAAAGVVSQVAAVLDRRWNEKRLKSQAHLWVEQEQAHLWAEQEKANIYDGGPTGDRSREGADQLAGDRRIAVVTIYADGSAELEDMRS